MWGQLTWHRQSLEHMKPWHLWNTRNFCAQCKATAKKSVAEIPTRNENPGDTSLTSRCSWQLWRASLPQLSGATQGRAGGSCALSAPGQELTILGADRGPGCWAGWESEARGALGMGQGRQLHFALGATRGQESGQGVMGWERIMSCNKSARMHLPWVRWEIEIKNPSRFHSLLNAICCDIDIEIKHTLCLQATEKQS